MSRPAYWTRAGAACALALGLGSHLSPPAAAQTLPMSAGRVQPSAAALQQIHALLAAKAALTPTQQRIDSHLLLSSQAARGLPGVSSLRTLAVHPDVQPDAQGKVLVDISGPVSRVLLARIAAVGGSVIGTWPGFDATRASLPLTQIETVAAVPGVRFLRPASHGHVRTSHTVSSALSQVLLPGDPLSVPALAPARLTARREARVRAALASFAASPLSAPIGLVNTADPQGDFVHRADLARKTFGVTGSGVKIGVLSDSVDGLAAEQRRGSLGPVTVLPGQSGTPGSGEGTAMLEIVHRLAPGAQLYFATAYDTPENFAQNILNLQKAGCNIIVDDVGYFDEPPFEDGVIAQAVNAVTAAGAFYFSAAGNDYSVDYDDGFTATWEGDWKDSGKTYSGEPLLDFGGGVSQDPVILPAGYPAQYGLAYVDLYWADPQGGATDDYDLFTLDSTGALIDYSANTQDGTQDPFEQAIFEAGGSVLVAKYSGQGVFLHMTLQGDGTDYLGIGTAGATYGHNCAVNAYDVAAVPADSDQYGGTGDYSARKRFSASDITEYFSSDGPRRLFFNTDGTPINTADPTNFSSTGGVLRPKPTLAAADGIVDFFNPFYGTSAAAPHAAAIAALALSAHPGLTQAQMLGLLTSPSVSYDIDGAGYDRDSGFGLLDAYNAVSLAKTSAP